MSGKQDLFEAYLKRIGKKTGGLADYASAGGKNIKSALSIQGTKSYMPTLPVVTGGHPPVLSAEPLRFEKVNKEPEQAEPETKQPQMLTTEPEREGRGLRPEAYLVREQRGLRDEAYRPKETPLVPAATRSLADIQAEIDEVEAEAKKVRYKQAANETIRKVEKLKEEYYYTKNAEAWEKLSDADKDLMLAAAAEWQQTKDANVQTAMQNAVAGAYGFANGTTLPAQAQMKEKARSAVKTDDFDGLFEYAKRIYNAEQQAKRTEEVTEWAKENPTGAFFAQAGTNLATGLANLDVIGNGIRNFGAGAENYVPLDTSSPLWSAAHATSDLVSGGVQAVEERNEDKFLGKELGILGGQEIGSFLYQTGASGLNSIVNLGVAALTGGVAGLSGKAVSTLSSIAMGNQSVANTILANKEQGMTDSDAVSLGIISGVVEAVTEKYSLDTLLSADATKLAGMVNKIIKNPAANSVVKALVAEGSEETASYVLNAVADVLVRGNENDIRTEYNRYIDAGMTKGEALGRTVLDILGEAASSFLGGALMGLALGGGKAAVDTVARKSETKNTAGQATASAPQMPVNAAENAAVSNVGEAAKDVENAAPVADFKTETGNYAASNVDPESASAKKAAYQYTEAESKQKSTAEVLEDLTDKELAELDTAYPQQADTHQRISVKQNDEIARQWVEIDMAGEKKDLAKKDSWNAEDVATAQAILVKQRDMWRSAPEGDARQNARDAFNAWYDVVLEHKTTTAQAMRQMQEYVTKMAADDPVIARMVIEKELAKVNAKGVKEFGEDKWTPFVLTEEENSRIESLVPGDEASLENIIADIGRRIQREYPSTFREKITEFTHVNMLLNSMTLLKNPLANVFLQGVSRASSKVSALTQAAIHAFDKDFKPTQALSVSKQSKDLAKSVWERVGEDIAEQGQRYDKNNTEKSGYKLLPYANKKEVFKPRKQLPMLEKLAETASENLNKLSTRLVGAELFSEMSEEKSALENLRQLTYGLLELGDRGFVRASFVNRLASYIEARGITEAKDIPDEAFQLALEASLMDTFKDDNRVSNMMVGIKRALNEVGAGELLMPFVKTPANVTMRTIEYSPVGALVNSVKAIKEGRKINAAKKNGGIYNAGQLSRTLDMAAKGLTGSVLMATGALLAHLGVITGGVSDDEDEAAFLEQAGWKPFSFVTPNGKYISFDWAQPAAMPLILGASAYENTGKDGQGFLDIMTDFAVTYFDTIFEQSTLQEFEKLFGGYGSTGDNIVDVVMNYPLRFVSSGVYAATKSTDNIVRETYEKGEFSSSAKTLINKMYARIPGLSKTLPAKYDIWGQIVKRDETYGEAFFNAYFNPGTVTSYKQTKENDEVLRLYDSTKNAAVFPMKPDRSVELDVNNSRQKIDCTNEQYSELCKETGLAAKSLMDAAMKSGYYKNLPDDDKVAFLAKMWSLSKVAGKVAVFEKDGAIVPGAVNNRAWSVYERDGAAGVIRYYSIKQDADANVDDSVSKGEVLIYLDGKNWSSQEKGNWLSTFVTSPESDVQQVVNQYGEGALASWYDYYSVLYADALAYKEKQGNEDVSLGALRQYDLAKETLNGMKISDEQRAYYWDLISKEDSWQNRNPYD